MYERLVVVAVVGVVLALAVPTFLNQREKAVEPVRFNILGGIYNTIRVYKEVEAESGTYPEPGTYTQDRPIEDPEGNTVYTPPPNVTITTSTTPAGDLTVEGESVTLAGTFKSSFDSATGTYTQSSS
jgi:type IV pilus assembly protein PilA